jgi:hypothetical protein
MFACVFGQITGDFFGNYILDSLVISAHILALN